MVPSRRDGRGRRRCPCAVSLLIGVACALGPASALAEREIIAVHTVQPGEYLSRLAVRYYGNADEWRAIFEANPQLEEPDRVDPGEELRIPRIAADEAASVADGEPITLVTSNDFHPFADAELADHGMGVRIARAAFRAAGYAPNIEVVDRWSIVERETRELEYDVAVPYVQTVEREAIFDFSDSLYPMQSQIFVRADSPMPAIWNDGDLAGKRTCKPTGYYLLDVGPYIDIGYIGLKWADSMVGCFEQLVRGEVDFVPANRYTGWTTIIDSEALDPADFVHLPKPLARAPLRIMVSRDHPAGERILDDFNEALSVLKATGQVNQLRARAIDDFHRRVPRASAATVDGVRQPEFDRASTRGPGPTVYTANHYAPFADEDLPFGGMSAEVVRRAIQAGFDHPLFIDVRPNWPDVAEGVLAGDAVAAFPYVRTRSREARGFIFSEPLHDMQVEVFVRNDDPLQRLSGIASLSGRTVCKPAGYYMRDVRQVLDSGLVEVLEPRPASAAACMEALVAGRADFVSMNPHVAAGAIERADIRTHAVRSIGPLTRLELHVMAADTDAGRAFVRRINRQLRAMADRGSLDEIQERHRRLFQR